ncbi:MAG: major capsid protein [Clostridiales Family XIII bacterium]|nr:major capsid protein [Clostridia bacterium]MDY3011442.1 major capsid protein [Clostridiales Family XIII bacterium]MDY4602101.1 major capsid protein [Bacteroides uniformis]
MALDIFKTHTLLMAVEQLTPPVNFLRDRFFPTNDATDIFATDDVLIEYKDGSRKLAPFVAPRKGGLTILRDGYEMQRYTPPNIAPRRILTIDDLNKLGFGEALYTQLTPDQRQNAMILKDADELGQMIARREEAMAAETMLNNGCIMRHYADDMTLEDEKEIRFYSEASNPAVYTPATKWGTSGARILDDINVMAETLEERGLYATDLICAPDIAPLILNDPAIKELADIRNYELLKMAPDLTSFPGATLLTVLNVYGRSINIIIYKEKYEDENGATKQFIPAGHVILTAPAAGRTTYGAVTQLEDSDKLFHTYAAKRVPKYVADVNGNTRTITITSRPLLVPNNKNPWITSKVTA